MELTPLRYFVAIARAGHITRAAAALGVTQPALSAAVQRLESEVGADLLLRTGKGVELTEAGRAFLTHAEETLRAAHATLRAVREVMGLERGSIRVGGGATAVAYLLPPVVSALRKKHEGLRFFVREAGSSDVARAVLSGELDLGIVTLPVAIPDADALVRVPLVEDELRLIVPPGHRLAPKTARSTASAKRRAAVGEFRWKDIAGEPFVAFEAGTAVRSIVDRAAAAAGVTLNVVMELRSIESIKSMVSAGIGVALVSRFALNDGKGSDGERHDREGLVCRDGRLARSLVLIRRRARPSSPAAEAFEKELLTRVGKQMRR